MLSKYYGSAKITYFDKAAVWRALRKLAADLGELHPEIARISVFGSLVRDEAAPGSDVDLLMTLEQSDLPFSERSPYYRPRGFLVPLEVFVYTKNELREMLEDGNFFIKRALSEAAPLFDRIEPV